MHMNIFMKPHERSETLNLKHKSNSKSCVSVMFFAPEEYVTFLTFSLEQNIVSGHRFSAALFAAKADIEHFEQILSRFIWKVR